MSNKCILYARFSPRPKHAMEDCQSIGVQLAACRAFAAQKGYEVAGSFVDEGKSRNDFDRPGLLQAISELRRGWKLIAMRPDRIGSGMGMGVLEHKIESRGASIEYTHDEFNGDSPAKRMVRSVLSAIAEYERELTGMRTSAGMRYRSANGERMTHHDTLPIGRMLDPKDDSRTVVNPEEQEIVDLVAGWHKRGEGPTEIARRLNASRHKPRGKRWHRTTVVRMIERIDRNRR